MFSRNESGISCAAASCSALTRRVAVVRRELAHRADGVVDLGGDPHAAIVRDAGAHEPAVPRPISTIATPVSTMPGGVAPRQALVEHGDREDAPCPTG